MLLMRGPPVGSDGSSTQLKGGGAMDEKKIVVLDAGVALEEIADMQACCKGKPQAVSR